MIYILCSLSPFFIHLKLLPSGSDPTLTAKATHSKTTGHLYPVFPAALIRDGPFSLKHFVLASLKLTLLNSLPLLTAPSQSPVLCPLSAHPLKVNVPKPSSFSFILCLLSFLCLQQPSKLYAIPKYMSGEAVKPNV